MARLWIFKEDASSIDRQATYMETIISLITSQDWLAWIGAITALLGAVIAIAQLIPGDEPENTLQKIVDFLAKFSRK